MNSDVKIRKHKPDDFKVLMGLIDEADWNLSLIDLKACLELDSNGLLVAEDKSGFPVGFIGLFNMLSDMIYLAFYIVKKELRGKGIGKKLWSVMLSATKGKNLCLDSVPNMKDWYAKQGFDYEAFCTTFYKGTITSNEYEAEHSTYDVVFLTDDVWPALIAYDMQIHSYNRAKIMRAWFCGEDKYSIIALYNGKVVGYANMHLKSEKQWNVRVLYGDDKAVADALLMNLLQKIPVGSDVAFYLFGDKPIPKLCTSFQNLGAFPRLYTKRIRDIQTEKIFFGAVLML